MGNKEILPLQTRCCQIFVSHTIMVIPRANQFSFFFRKNRIYLANIDFTVVNSLLPNVCVPYHHGAPTYESVFVFLPKFRVFLAKKSCFLRLLDDFLVILENLFFHSAWMPPLSVVFEETHFSASNTNQKHSPK